MCTLKGRRLSNDLFAHFSTDSFRIFIMNSARFFPCSVEMAAILDFMALAEVPGTCHFKTTCSNEVKSCTYIEDI